MLFDIYDYVGGLLDPPTLDGISPLVDFSILSRLLDIPCGFATFVLTIDYAGLIPMKISACVLHMSCFS